MNKRMNRSRLNIGTYFLDDYARTDAHVADLRACGIDFVIGATDYATLDLYEKHNVGAILGGIVPGWWGGDGDNAGKLEETNPLEKYTEAAAKFVDHKAVWGIDAGDEPSALDFPYYGKVIETMNNAFENQFAYLNLYPNYASVAQNNAVETVNQLGTATYAEHIARYCENVPSDYICYDFYPYASPRLRLQHFENLCIVACACRNTGRSMWIVLQVNSNDASKHISEDQLRYQAYSSMAFGAENIIWACYTAGWWHNQVLDDKGEKTEQYDKLKKINAEIRSIADAYMSYRRTSTHFIAFDNVEGFEKVGQPSERSLSTGVFRDITSDKPTVIGQMASRNTDGKVALFVFAASDPEGDDPSKTTISFNSLREVKVTGTGNAVVAKVGDTYKVTIDSNAACLIEA